MPTTIQAIVTQTRRAHLQEVVPRFWTDDELLGHANTGIQDLWRTLKDTYQDHFRTIDATNVSLAANSSTLTGVPDDCTTVLGLEPRTPTTSPVVFSHKDYLHPDFVAARQQAAADTSQRTVLFYDIDGPGAPVAAPNIRVAPQVGTALLVTLVYVPYPETVALADNNPIPGGSDKALEYWIAAHAIPKQRGENQPDAGFMGMYEAERSKLLTGVTPRDESEPEVVQAVFEDEWSD